MATLEDMIINDRELDAFEARLALMAALSSDTPAAPGTWQDDRSDRAVILAAVDALSKARYRIVNQSYDNLGISFKLRDLATEALQASARLVAVQAAPEPAPKPAVELTPDKWYPDTIGDVV